MKLEQQVCSLELAKRLKELGVKQESYFYWLKSKNPIYSEHFIAHVREWEEPIENDEYSAFTSAELGEILPLSTKSWSFSWSDDENIYKAWTCNVEGKNHNEDGKTEADARAKMLIYLLEHNLLTL